MMQAMVDNVTGMVYWLPVDHSAVAAAAPMPPFVMQPASSYRLLRPVMTPQQVPVGVPVETNTTVFVRGIPREATTQSVESHFNVHGEVVSCHVIRHKDASTNKGIAFVKFRDAQAAQRAINANHPGVMDAREVFAEWAHPRPASSAMSRALPDHQLVSAGFSSTPARVYLTSPAPRHVITGPGFLPFASPGFLPFGGTPLAPYGSASYLSPGVGGHVLGFPVAGALSGGESHAPHERFSTSGNNYYIPLTDTYNSAYSSATPAVISTIASSSRNQSRYEIDIVPAADPEAKSESELHEADSLTLDQLHLGDPERIPSTKSRKGKDEEQI